MSIINVTQENSILSVNNPLGSVITLTLANGAGGSGKPLSNNLIITKL